MRAKREDGKLLQGKSGSLFSCRVLRCSGLFVHMWKSEESPGSKEFCLWEYRAGMQSWTLHKEEGLSCSYGPKRDWMWLCPFAAEYVIEIILQWAFSLWKSFRVSVRVRTLEAFCPRLALQSTRSPPSLSLDLDLHQISISLLFSYRMASSSRILPGHALVVITEQKHNMENMRAQESSHLKQGLM